MKKTLTTLVMLLILMFALSTSVQAYTMSFAGTKAEVESGETFNVTISVDEATTLANGHIKYDTSLFTFVNANQTNLSAENYAEEGTVKWMYTDLTKEPAGTQTFTFSFKAAEVTETTKGTFAIDDFIVSVADEELEGDAISGPRSVEVIINKKVEKPTEPTWTLNPSDDFEMKEGDTKKIETEGDVTWTSSNPEVATVDKDGNVKAIKRGTTTITATDKDGNKQSIKVTVVGANDWTLNPSKDFELEKGETKKIETDEEVTWTTSNSKVVTVDKNGNVKAVGLGTATITATDKDGNKRTIKVTVVAKDTTSGNKDNTTTNDSKLPQTGEDFKGIACLGLAAVVLAAGIVCNKKAKKLFVILPLVAIISLSGAVNAVKVVDNSTMKAGIFEKGDLLEDVAVVAISPCTDFQQNNKLTVDRLKEVFPEEKYTIVALKDAEGNDMELTTEKIPTGAVVSVQPVAGEGESAVQALSDYTVLLYGDANGDGTICNCLDVDVIRQDYVYNNKAEGVYREAADLHRDGKLNVLDIKRIIDKYLGKSEGSLVTPFPGEKEIVLNPNEDFDLGIGDAQTVTADTEVEWSWDEDSDVADVVVNEDGSVTITGKNPGEISLTATDENGNEKTLIITVISATIEIKDYTQGSITVEASIEGKEIASVKHLYRTVPGFSQSNVNTWSEVENSTTAEYEYTNDELTDGWPYQFMAEITTADGKIYETNIVDWKMGYIGENPAITVTATPNEDSVTVNTVVTNDVDVDNYKYTIQKKNANGSYSNTEHIAEGLTTPEYTFEGLEDGNYQVIAVASTKKGAYKVKSVTFTINTVAEGETDDETEAVARIESNGKMFKTVQYAVNAAAETDTVTMLKESTESVVIPEEKNIILDLNGNTLEATDVNYAITNNGNLTIMNSNAEVFGQVLSADNANNAIITKGNLTLTTNEEETSTMQITLKAKGEAGALGSGEATVKNIGTNNTIKLEKGAILTGTINDYKNSVGILDENTGATVIIEKGNLGGALAGIKKTGSGEIIIGSNEQDLYAGATGPTGPIYLSINGRDSAILVDENVDVKFYNGYLSSNTVVSKNVDGTIHEFDATRDGYGTTLSIIEGADGTYAYYREMFKGETLDRTEAVARIINYPAGYYTSIQAAVDAIGSDEKTSGGKVQLLKSTTEAVNIPEGITPIELDLNGNTLTAPEGKSAITANARFLEIINSATTQASVVPSTVAAIKLAGTDSILELTDDVKYTGTAVETDVNYAGEIIVNNATWEGSGAERFINNEGAGKITILSGDYRGYTGVVLSQNASGILTIGDKNEDITKDSPKFLARDGVIDEETQATVNFYNGFLSSRSITGDVEGIDGKRDDAFLFNNASEAYYIELKEGQTLKEEEAVAQLAIEKTMFKTVQAAVDAVQDSGAIIILKDVTESVEIPETKTSVSIDLKGHTITSDPTKLYTIKTAANLGITDSSETPGTLLRDTYDGTQGSVQGNEVYVANIYVDNTANLTLSNGINLDSKCGGTANIYDSSTGDIIINNANITTSANGTYAIYDNLGGNTYIYEGDLHGYFGLKKTSGNLYIGKDSQEVTGITGTQAEVLTGTTTPQLVIRGATSAIQDSEELYVYYYNGALTSTYSADNVYSQPYSGTFAKTRTGCTLKQTTQRLAGYGSSGDAPYWYFVEGTASATSEEVSEEPVAQAAATAGTEMLQSLAE